MALRKILTKGDEQLVQMTNKWQTVRDELSELGNSEKYDCKPAKRAGLKFGK